MSLRICLLVALCFTGGSLEAQNGTPERNTPQKTLRALLDSLEAKRTVRDEARAKLERAVDAAEREAHRADLRAIEDEIAQLQTKFETIAAGVDVAELRDKGPATFDLKQEVVTLLEPLVKQLKEATEEPRKIEQLSSQVQLFSRRLEMAQRALVNLRKREEEATDEATRGEIRELINVWEARLEEFRNRQAVAAYELQTNKDARSSLMDSVRNFVGGFFRSRGANLSIALGCFLLVFLALRFVRRRALKLIFRHGATFYSRVASVTLQVLSFICAIGAMVLALFSVSDWVLLVVVLIFLVGIGWASVNMLPQFFEQVRLLLNLGSVREGERVILDGLPWRVDELKIYTVLRNPDLSGGEYRIPIRDLVGLHSRPIGAREVWFPCREGDWVSLSDGVRGRISVQSPDLVQLIEAGGARRTYRTADFLGQCARNMSANFRLVIKFGIDYSHQAIATTEVPDIMARDIRTGLSTLVKDEELHQLTVEFSQAGASSLDYDILLDLSGEAAARSEIIRRAVSRMLVDTCNEQQWIIPFAQLTVHKAS